MEEIELHPNIAKVEISLHGIIEDTFTKKVVFLVTTSGENVTHVKYRNYSDFVQLRLILIKKWTVLVVPNFCKLSIAILKNYSDEYLERKKKYLKKFLNECCHNGEIFNSAEFQSFIKGNENFVENSKNITQDFRVIYTVYVRCYKGLEGQVPSIEEIKECYESFKTTLVDLKRLKKVLKQLCEKHQSIHGNHLKCYEKLQNIQSLYINAMSNNVEEGNFFDYSVEINPYFKLFNWATQENLTLKSLIEAIEKLFEIVKVTNVLHSKILKKREKIKNLESGKPGFSMLFEGKPTMETIAKESFSINDMENEANCTSLLANIISSQISFKIIPDFLASKKPKYYKYLQKFCEKSLISFSVKPT